MMDVPESKNDPSSKGTGIVFEQMERIEKEHPETLFIQNKQQCHKRIFLLLLYRH